MTDTASVLSRWQQAYCHAACAIRHGLLIFIELYKILKAIMTK
jgi:hypothetical protein